MTTPKQTKCIYCGLTLRGRGCPYSPAKVHIHPTPDRCIYCNLTLRGRGCQYSPSGVHIRFVEFGALQSEQTENHLMMAYLIERLNTSAMDTPAYAYGIVDENGYQIKQPSTVMEQRSFTPLDKYIFRLKRAFGDKLESINTEMLLESTFQYMNQENIANDQFDPEQYLKQVDTEHTLKTDLARIISEYYNCIRDATKGGVSTPKLEQILTQVLTEHDVKE